MAKKVTLTPGFITKSNYQTLPGVPASQKLSATSEWNQSIGSIQSSIDENYERLTLSWDADIVDNQVLVLGQYVDYLDSVYRVTTSYDVGTPKTFISGNFQLVGAESGGPNYGNPVTKTVAVGILAIGADRNIIVVPESGNIDSVTEITGMAIGDEVLLRANVGDALTLLHNDAGATIKILIQDQNDFLLDEDHPLELVLTSSITLVQVYDEAASGNFLIDGSGTTANGSAVDLGGDMVGNTIIRIPNGGSFVIRDPSAAPDGNMRKLTMSPAEILLEFVEADIYAPIGFERSGGAVSPLGGIYAWAQDLAGGGKLGGFSLGADGTILIGDPGKLGRAIKAYYDSDYNALWDAFGQAEQDRVIPDIAWILANFLNSLRATDQSIASKVEFKSQAHANTGANAIKAFSATPIFDFNADGNDQQMFLSGNITAFSTANEAGSANYSIWIINDATAGRTVSAPVGWTIMASSDDHDGSANAENLYQFKTRPDGEKKYTILNI